MARFLVVVGVLALGLTACGDSGGSPDGIVGPTWQLQEFLGGDDELVNPEDPTSYTLTLNDDGSASIVADCNQVNATYTLDEPELTFEIGASTLVACAEGSVSDRYVGWLENAVSFVMDDDDLVISLFASSGTLRFASS